MHRPASREQLGGRIEAARAAQFGLTGCTELGGGARSASPATGLTKAHELEEKTLPTLAVTTGKS